MKAQIVSFHCTLTNAVGQLISSTFNREVITSVEGQETILGGLALGLQNLKDGEKRRICLPADKAYGFYDPKKVILYPRKKIAHNRTIQCGEKVELTFRGGGTRVFRVTQLHNDMVTLDGNHELAGQDLIFDIETITARPATHEEIQASSNPVSTQHLH